MKQGTSVECRLAAETGDWSEKIIISPHYWEPHVSKCQSGLVKT
jgi:hypothetical protein